MVSFFLGANSPHGFFSLYDELIDRGEAEAVYILKGGPGCGKSTLMKKVASAAEKSGQPVEYIRCSGDPDSLDAVILPDLKTAIVDGTAPHVVEPKLPGAVDHYIDLGACYDGHALLKLRTELTEAGKEHKACYERAYRCLEAASDIRSVHEACLAGQGYHDKFAKRIRGIISRELRTPGGEQGKVTHRFLSALSCYGHICQWESVQDGYKKLYILEDAYGLAHHFLLPIMTASCAAGYDSIACLSPLAPERLEHLLIPSLGLAFLSSSPSLPCPFRGQRRIHLDAMLDHDQLRSYRQRLRFSRKVSDALMQEGILYLEEAKAAHDRLEAIYHPHVDFDRVNAIADQLIGQLGLEGPSPSDTSS